MPAIRELKEEKILGKSVWVGNCIDEVFAGDISSQDIDAARGLWNELDEDAYLHDGGRYRARRYAELRYEAKNDALIHTESRDFYQSTAYNAVNGGTRRFSLIEASFLESSLLQAILKHFSRRFSSKLGVNTLELYLHQVRITGRPGEVGHPTPEGIHKDGVDFSCQVLFGRENVQGGESIIYDNNKVALLGATMEQPLDFYCFADGDIYHSVTPISPLDGCRYATRDILGIEFCVNREKRTGS
ncbi:2OG-Fe dioxygenase family protein [uncultured Herbaspirillum sp.]|uniref:2OG-Fe dioxygenase family protein n=1 Tax=uncultured Herbaspirillum sp. TaxID=160236 RepID=UPI00258C52B8|nr:2OG-Fe dioxygenase family protein [uncultured Herbaspirillum sp.]